MSVVQQGGEMPWGLGRWPSFRAGLQIQEAVVVVTVSGANRRGWQGSSGGDLLRPTGLQSLYPGTSLGLCLMETVWERPGKQ